MKYRESTLDQKLRRWFVGDNTKGLLRSISLREGKMRGLSKFKIDIDYPITAIAGKNGSGKSTVLALACCGFHNNSKGYKLRHRKQSYYTFADFFIQHSEEIPPEGIEIFYKIAHNNWRKSERFPEGVGVGFQTRKKKKDGRWNDYSKRVLRDVVFLGIERIVPHNEKSQSKSYSRSFAHNGNKGWEDSVKNTVGKILGKKYDDFKYVTHSKYRLPIVTVNGKKYSGFNMGAGENALFEVFSVMHSVSEGALIVVDEIELGLHAEAQKKFIQHLKNLCLKRKLQIICTTHSKEIFEQIPDDSRVFIDNPSGNSSILKGISPEFAFSKMSAINSNELTILVEDKVAKSILLSILPSNIRFRTTIEVIGSATSLAKQLAANYNREKRENIVAIFDGDQRTKEKSNIKHAVSMAECSDQQQFKEWIKNCIEYLPGETWPEAWLVQKCSESMSELANIISIDEDELTGVIESGLQAGKHSEFYEIGNLVGLDEQRALNMFCLCLSQHHRDIFDDLIEYIECKLNG